MSQQTLVQVEAQALSEHEQLSPDVFQVSGASAPADGSLNVLCHVCIPAHGEHLAEHASIQTHLKRLLIHIHIPSLKIDILRTL